MQSFCDWEVSLGSIKESNIILCWDLYLLCTCKFIQFISVNTTVFFFFFPHMPIEWSLKWITGTDIQLAMMTIFPRPTVSWWQTTHSKPKYWTIWCKLVVPVMLQIYETFSDWQVWENHVDPDQAPEETVWSGFYTVCHSVSIFHVHYGKNTLFKF